MSFKDSISLALRILLNPATEFAKLKERSLEAVLGDYLRLLVFSSLAAYIFNAIIYLLRPVYLKLFYSVDIKYLNVLNYGLGNSTSIMFFYIFTGTFLVFLLTSILYRFFKSVKFVKFLMIICYSLTPLVLFSWIYMLIPGLIVWSIFLFTIGWKHHLGLNAIRKDSIENRD